ncbi:hypothetical protein E3U43_017558 [Larimichthys crocea]|uniref:Uncharacterized protein n=1 Tax=Larimichthys crocea TaxID=215358 RepID=A0ACD3QZK4_LARCR|nr:hypothetical protein E3U43_017558 [Larimichthys crocea]
MQDTDPPTDTTPTADTQQTEEEEASPQSSPRKDGGDWLLDSALGKWLSSKQVVCSNLTLLKVLLWLVLLGLFAEAGVWPAFLRHLPLLLALLKDSAAQLPASPEN